MVNQEREAAVISIHRVAVQQVTGFRLFSPRLQKRSSTSAAEERCLGGRPDEELQTGHEFVVSFQAFGESRTISTSGILGQQQHDA